MALATVSLQRRVLHTLIILLCVAFAAIALAILYFTQAQNTLALQKNILLKHQVVQQSLNGYLARAEDEMKFIGQNLSSSHSVAGRELDVLFSQHEVLLFGGLDFFFIEWANGTQSTDPRARLFTTIDFRSVLKFGLFNRWTSVVTQDGATLLMVKTKLLSIEQKSLGFLYGFISLNDNLTLANEMLSSAQVSTVQIYDKTHKSVLLKEQKAGVDVSGALLTSSLPLVSAIQGDLQLDISQVHSVSSVFLFNAMPLILTIACLLLGFYWLLSRYIRLLIFQPLETMAFKHDSSVPLYREWQPIQQQSHHYLSSIRTKEQRFSLLSESTHSAIMFCNEVAEIELMNTDAQHLFPDYAKARTLFDFMPISCHQAIQDALKGDVGVVFNLTINALGRIYQWQAYSFKNEKNFRSVLFVGRNITQETSLTWQLKQLQPLSSSVMKRVDTEAMLNELRYLAQWPHVIHSGRLQGWLTLLLSVFEDIANEQNDGSGVPIGAILRQESERVMAAMGEEANRVQLDCSVATGQTLVASSASISALVRVLLMMAMSNDMAERHLTMHFDGDELDIVVTNDMASRPLFAWMVRTLLESLNGQQKTLQNNALQLNLVIKPILSSALPCESPCELMADQVVAWVVNDYPYSDVIEETLKRLGVSVKTYASTNRFFTQSNTLIKYDAVLIGCDHEIEAQQDMTQVLKLKQQRDHLPIVWLNQTSLAEPDSSVFTLRGCFFDYNLHQVLLKACALSPIEFTYTHEQQAAWLMVGGSRVSKAIWFTALEKYHVATQWLADLHNYDAVLSYRTEVIVVLLEPQPADRLRLIQADFPKVRFFSLQKWPEMPDNVTLFEMNMPYSSEQIQRFTQSLLSPLND
ncbi:hypothetical protein [Marinomonas sp. IMCC 4694]|uniref:hypothetical protein n=1 Tax=Marinomonas sp. IMCC 4694 TaxID=2605432 RepID=UPI0011E6493C|nr:hypothetical protein [Marinomonas sp. IMCC 4694]TYL49183.1 hypothetical protein FXV75_15435 [Marinomonas sp. IMCC 4694]